jgi:hypothetical protein
MNIKFISNGKAYIIDDSGYIQPVVDSIHILNLPDDSQLLKDALKAIDKGKKKNA